MSHPIVTSVTIAAGAVDSIALSQSLGAAGPLILNGTTVTAGVAILDAARRVIIVSAADDSGITFTVTGTARSQQGGAKLVEVIAGANTGTATTTQDFATVTSIVASGATAGTVTAGTNGTASGPWVVWSQFQSNFEISLFGRVLTGSPTWQVDYTYDDVFGTWLPPGQPFPIAIALPTLIGETGSADGSISNTTVRATRLTLTVAGGVQLVSTQQGL